MEELRAQFKMSNNWSVKSIQVSNIALCACRKVERGAFLIKKKNVPNEIVLAG